MGSKQTMLRGTLGSTVLREASTASRFVDLFAGSGAVSQFVAQNLRVPTVSVDQLQFSGVLAGSITMREKPADGDRVFRSWFSRAQLVLDEWSESTDVGLDLDELSAAGINDARRVATGGPKEAFILRHYGGHYFSPSQALILSAFHKALPVTSSLRRLCLAVLIRAASRCSASPGHTAQPFQPTETLIPHIRAAWAVDVKAYIQAELETLAPLHALRRGTVVTGDAESYAHGNLRRGDLVFCDPPYSEAQYSRFYHVLEGIARGGWSSVEGAGRAPALKERATSDFSRRSTSSAALESLLFSTRKRACTVLITYPEGDRSNGLDLEEIKTLAIGTNYAVEERMIAARHSTLGGSANHVKGRAGSRDINESLLILRPA